MKQAVLLAAAALVGTEAFVAPMAGTALARPAAARTTLHMSAGSDQYKVSDKEGKVYVASEITEDSKESAFKQEFADHGVDQFARTDADINAGPATATYEGLIDGDTFDGGDGQVGCVGDGDNKLDKFETNAVVKARTVKGEAIGGSESKKTRANAWGAGQTGYADELKAAGMVKIKDGEDMLAVRRQQLENWRNQQELQAAQRAKIQQLDTLTGEEQGSKTWKRGSSHSYMDALAGGAPAEEQAWNTFTPPKAAETKSDGTSWDHVKLTGKEKITDTITCISESGRPGFQTINVKNSVMTFEPFHCEYVGDDIDGFEVNPKTGTLNRRNGDPIPVQVSFKPNGPGDARSALLVIETEEDKWVYQIDGRSA